MTQARTRNKQTPGPALPQAAGVVPIATLDVVATTIERITGRHDGLPGMAVLHGPAGWGKSFCANAMCNEQRGYYVQIRSAWSRKYLLQKILFEMGIRRTGVIQGAALKLQEGTVSKLLDDVCVQLAASNRPLVLDEFDYCTGSDTMIELVRDIYEGSQGALLLIGEEGLPQKLEAWERFHSRVLAWAPALPVSVADAEKLASIYCPGVAVADDMIAHLVEIAAGSVRRVCVNLTNIHTDAMTFGESEVSRASWGNRPLYTGKSPERRSA